MIHGPHFFHNFPEEESIIETDFEPVEMNNPESVFQALNLNLQEPILSSLFDLTKDPQYCEIFIEFIPNLIEILASFIYHENLNIQNFAKRILINLFLTEPNEESTQFSRSLYNYFTSLASNTETRPLFFSVLFNLISRSLLVKRSLIAANIFDVFLSINVDTIEESLMLLYTKIISSFLSNETIIDSKVRVELLSRMRFIIMTISCDQEVINECLSTLDRVTTDVSFTPSLISSDLFQFLFENYESFTNMGKTSLLSIFSHLYGCQVPILKQKVLETIPFDFFLGPLQDDDSHVKLNAIISIINCFRNVPETIQDAFEKGIVDYILSNIADYDFDSKKLALRALYIVAKNANSTQFHCFETPEYIQVFTELLEPNDSEANNYISDFVRLYTERSNEEDCPELFEFIDIFMLEHDIQNTFSLSYEIESD